MLEILVGLAVLWVLKRVFMDKGGTDKTDPEIVPFINPHDHRDGVGPNPFSGDDFEPDWDADLIDEMIDDGIDDELIH